MKKLHLLLIAFMISGTLIAQKSDSTDFPKNKLEFEGYTIKLIPSEEGYGFEISKKTITLMYQPLNPFNGSSKGLKKKEDVVKIAKWIINQVRNGKEEWSTHAPKLIPINVATELSIDLNK